MRSHRSDRCYPPDYVSRETLAYRLDMKVGAIDQLVKRGVLPFPLQIGEATRWRWPDVDQRIRGTENRDELQHEAIYDPYLRAIDGAAANCEHPTTAARSLREGKG